MPFKPLAGQMNRGLIKLRAGIKKYLEEREGLTI